jgi:outer membrane protein assembly factor BamE (lipoprotein component of BamABCDE complex)
MAKKNWYNLVLAAAVFAACERPLPEMTGIDLKAWKRDKNGCAGDRASVVRPLQEQRNKLQGLSEMQVIELLGRPDQNELYKRNQKFYFYWLEPGKTCGGATDGKRLSVRFNAMGLAKEIAVE